MINGESFRICVASHHAGQVLIIYAGNGRVTDLEYYEKQYSYVNVGVAVVASPALQAICGDCSAGSWMPNLRPLVYQTYPIFKRGTLGQIDTYTI